MDVVVDTSIWSLAFRRKVLVPRDQVNRDELAELIRDQWALLIGEVRQELLSGMREPSEFERLRGLLRPVPNAALDVEDFEEAAAIHNACRAAGIAGSPVDFLLCAVAVRRGVPLFTTDGDFERYAAHCALVLHRPTPAA